MEAAARSSRVVGDPLFNTETLCHAAGTHTGMVPLLVFMIPANETWPVPSHMHRPQSLPRAALEAGLRSCHGDIAVSDSPPHGDSHRASAHGALQLLLGTHRPHAAEAAQHGRQAGAHRGWLLSAGHSASGNIADALGATPSFSSLPPCGAGLDVTKARGDRFTARKQPSRRP